MLCRLFTLFTAVLLAATLHGQTVTFTVSAGKTAQTIDNIGASGAWYSEGIGKYWPDSIKNRMAELLFSRGFDAGGNPRGIGLSAWRFNIGGGSAEQGDSSGITSPLRRVECFLAPGGTYNWNKQAGYLWFVRQAKKYGVENLVAFSNTPPVQFTKNGLAGKTTKDFTSNLRDDKYIAYAGFLADVLAHFDKAGLHFNYISPVNEPQWDWYGQFGKISQEGTPWHNGDINKITTTLDSTLAARKLSSRIIIGEAGILTALYKGNGPAESQLQKLYNTGSPLYLGNLPHLQPVILGHSYFTDGGDSAIVNVRSRVRDTAAKYGTAFWQSEYCMLGDGYKQGKKGNIPAMDCALFLAKVIHNDLAVANAKAWHYWNAWEPGPADHDTRYYLLALQTNADNTAGSFTTTKNLWALGHYSRFIRPGMQRMVVQRSDSLNDITAAQDVMLSAFTGNHQLVAVVINHTGSTRKITLSTQGMPAAKHIAAYVTTAEATVNMRYSKLHSLQDIQLPPASITTVVAVW